MRPFLLWLFAAIIAAAVAGGATRYLVAHGPVRRRNYRGLELPATAGIGAIIGIISGLVLTAVLHMLFQSSRMLTDGNQAGLFFLAAIAAFGFLGLWDDVAGTPEERGWRAHLDALAHGRATAGAIKLLGGAAASLIIAGALERGFGWTIVDAIVIALSANAMNLLDKRPGRAGKWFLLAAIGLMIVGGPTAPGLAAAIGAVLLTMPYDLRERAMLGDAGANAMGGLLGVAIVVDSTHTFRLVALVLLALVTVFGARPGLSRVIESVGPLKRFDAAGRV
jgi:UDP-N-acetylmuramyl pentapeptide phosphotransferase/UDP-N-acetylglucosamine-1-phosphate transferase